MSQPLDRTCSLPELGTVNRAAGEFWENNPFQITDKGENLSAFERNCLFLNWRGESFIDASFASPADIDSDSRAAIVCDFDRDGAVDVLVVSVGGGPLRLFRNQFPRSNHRVAVKLYGTSDNRSAIGARVVVHCGGRKIVRDLFPPNGFRGMGPAEMLIGVGAAQRIDRLEIRWPGGEQQTFSKLPVDCQLVFVQGQNKYQSPSWAATTKPDLRSPAAGNGDGDADSPSE